MREDEFRERGANQSGRERTQRTEADLPALACLRQSRHLDALSKDVQGSPGVREEALAEGGEPDAATSGKQDASQAILQSLDARAHRRLTNPQHDRCATEAALANHPLKCYQLVQFHCLSLHRKHRCVLFF